MPQFSSFVCENQVQLSLYICANCLGDSPWRRGHGRVFYFRPGHETFPTYHHPQIQRVIANAVRWVHSGVSIPDHARHREPSEPLSLP